MAFRDTLNQAYIGIANDVASESVGTANHAQRLAAVKQFAQGGGGMDFYVTNDFTTQGYNDSTPMATMKTRLSSLLTNLVALGFGG